MGWTPREVRECKPEDFVACFEGWKSAQGITDPDEDLEDDIADLKALMERYPDE